MKKIIIISLLLIMTAGKENAFGIWTQKANVGGGLREGGLWFFYRELWIHWRRKRIS